MLVHHYKKTYIIIYNSQSIQVRVANAYFSKDCHGLLTQRQSVQRQERSLGYSIESSNTHTALYTSH